MVAAFPNKGNIRWELPRQYCGHLGKIANCQEGVFLAYASLAGYSFLDERLYLPQEWFEADHRLLRPLQVCRNIHFQTEGDLALDMLQN